MKIHFAIDREHFMYLEIIHFNGEIKGSIFENVC